MPWSSSMQPELLVFETPRGSINWFDPTKLSNFLFFAYSMTHNRAVPLCYFESGQRHQSWYLQQYFEIKKVSSNKITRAVRCERGTYEPIRYGTLE